MNEELEGNKRGSGVRRGDDIKTYSRKESEDEIFGTFRFPKAVFTVGRYGSFLIASCVFIVKSYTALIREAREFYTDQSRLTDYRIEQLEKRESDIETKYENLKDLIKAKNK